MNYVALETAEDRLVLCRRAVEALNASGDNQRAFMAHWFDFLIQWKGVYTKVQQAAKSNATEIQWFG
jgi:hypothetical protein